MNTASNYHKKTVITCDICGEPITISGITLHAACDTANRKMTRKEFKSMQSGFAWDECSIML